MIEFINIHTHRTGNEEDTFYIQNIALPTGHLPEKTFVSAGWHPWHIGTFNLEEIEAALNVFATEKTVLLIGECGFDRTIKTPVEKQAEVMRLHINAALMYHKPLIIHCVKAYSDLEHLLKTEKFGGTIVLHDFNGNQFQIERFLKFDSYFSLGKQLMNPNSNVQKSIMKIPIDRIFLETDETDYSIKEIYQQTANLLQLNTAELKRQIRENFKSLLGTSLFE